MLHGEAKKKRERDHLPFYLFSLRVSKLVTETYKGYLNKHI